jgi:PII-like signaling protein
MVGKAKLLRIYVGEAERFKGKSLYQHLVYWLKEKGISGVTVLRGIEGYGQDKVLRTFRILELSSDLPMVLEAVDSADKIEAILPEVCELVPKGLVFTSDIEVHKYGK